MRGAVVVPALATLFSTVSALPPARPEAGLDPETIPDGHLPELYDTHAPRHQKVLVSPEDNSSDLQERDVESRGLLSGGYDEYPKDDSYSFQLRVFVKVDSTKCRAAVNSDDRKVSRVKFADCSTEGLTLKFELDKDDFDQYNSGQEYDFGNRNDDHHLQDDYPVDRYEDYGRNNDYGTSDFGNNDYGRNGYDNNDFDRNGLGNNNNNGAGRNGYGNNDFDRHNEQCLPRCQCSPDDDNCQLCKSRCQCSPDNNKCEQTPRCQCSPEDDQCKKCNSLCQCSSGRFWKQMAEESHDAIEDEDCGDSCEASDTLLTRDTNTEAGGGGGYSSGSRYGDSKNGGSSFDYGYGDDRDGGSGYGYENHESSSYEHPSFDYPSQGNRGHGDDNGCSYGDCPPQKNKDKLFFILKAFRPLYQNDENPQGGNNGYGNGDRRSSW